MKTIQILGTGCPKCRQTERIVREVLACETIETTLEKVHDIQEIVKYGVLSTPAIIVDGVIQIRGRVPTKSEVLKALR